MCTLTFAPTKDGFFVGMNRDEQKDRVSARGPRKHSRDSLSLLYPMEPTGGTWIGLNSHGIVLALLNWYSAPFRPTGPIISRGVIIPQILQKDGLDAAIEAVRGLTYQLFNPFRLVGIFRAKGELREWAWNGRSMTESKWPWELRHWFSSGFEEKNAVQARMITARKAAERPECGCIEWIRSLHASHDPVPGPFSICMHRAEARTVSYTEIAVLHNQAVMSYLGDAPCSGGGFRSESLETL